MFDVTLVTVTVGRCCCVVVGGVAVLIAIAVAVADVAATIATN